jgi:hypothetical protein
MPTTPDRDPRTPAAQATAQANPRTPAAQATAQATAPTVNAVLAACAAARTVSTPPEPGGEDAEPAAPRAKGEGRDAA